ncbi:MAG: TetR/AcrR family transcriptional regulator, partial [Desulfovibrio sp.]|nr:TetR/AcrR family transcriptional regulator [Desulfovibrio sp.]
VNPPSLYATFGNKSSLFLEALRFYEKTYWQSPANKLMSEPDIRRAIAAYFDEAAEIILSPDNPCGCMVVTAAVNISDSETEIIRRVREIREDTRKMFAERLRAAIKVGQLPPGTDAPALAGAFNALLEGLSLQAKSGLFQSELKAMAACAVRMLPESPRG